MPLTELNHYFIRANDLEKTKQFYCDVLGFEVMPRPTFPFPGYWLGVNGKIQVHMGPDGIDNAEMYYLGTPKGAVTDHAGVVDHIAFLATEPGNFIRRFKERGLDFQPRSLAGVRPLPDLRQGPERAHDRAELLRPEGRHRLGRRGLLEDAAGRRDARVTGPVARLGLRRRRLRRGDAPGPGARADPARARRPRRGRAPDAGRHDRRPAPDRALPLPPAASLGRHGARLRGALRPTRRDRPRLRLDGLERRQPGRPPLDARALRRARPGRGVGQEPGCADRVGHRLSRRAADAGSTAASSSAASGTSRAASTPPTGTCWPSWCATASASSITGCAWCRERLRDRRRLARARHAEHRIEVGARQGRSSSPSTARSACTWRAAASQFPGARVNPNPLYQVPLSALGSHCLAAAGVGNAQAALELTIDAIRERSTSYTAVRMRDFQAVQLRVARAGAMVDAARLVIRDRLPRRRADRPGRARAGARGEAALQAQRRLRHGAAAPRQSTRCTRWPAPTGSTIAIRSSGSSATSTRSQPTSASAGTLRAGRGRWSRWAASSRPRCSARACRRRLLEPQGLDGVEAGGALGGIEAEDDADGGGDAEGDQDRLGRDQRLPLGEVGERVGAAEPQRRCR